MDNQKVVVILLLVTIILSIVSVILTFAVGSGDSRTVEKNIYTDNQGPTQSQLAFKIAPESERKVAG